MNLRRTHVDGQMVVAENHAYGLEGISPDPNAVVTVGTFDGVHLGHRAILDVLLDRARTTGGQSTVVSFDPHPREVTSGELVHLLTTAEERQEILKELGVERTVVVPFTLSFSKLSSVDFVERVIVRHVGCREIVLGYDHTFGHGASGDRALLEDLGRRFGFTVTSVPVQEQAQTPISSSRIRRMLTEEGDVASAAGLLGRDYRLSGKVVHGDGRGKALGFPTANLELTSARKAIPLRGVYAVRAAVDERPRKHVGMMNIGVRPTFGGTETRLEVHLLDFGESIYGARLRIEFVDRLRDERKFASVDQLVEQLSEDRRRCRGAVEKVS